jgi:sterol desaturase/sphingolipid hydroxylase (fatty acid hydroxylase superfamily)
MDGLVAGLQQFLLGDALLLMALMVLVIGLLELAIPARRAPARHYAFNLGYGLVTQLIAAALAPVVAGTTAFLIQKLGFGLIDLSALGFSGIGGAVFAMLVAALIFDFFFYWLHRLEHSNPVLWQEHVVHHSDHHMTVTSAARGHFLDTLLLPVFVSVPMAILFKLPPVTIAALSLVPYAWLYFIHGNLRVGFGPLWWLLVSPSYHRIHHSLEREHIDRNFANWFPLWDILFGTAVRPQRGEHPATGVAGVSIQSLPKALAFPFAAWVRMFQAWRTTGARPVRSPASEPSPGAAE